MALLSGTRFGGCTSTPSCHTLVASEAPGTLTSLTVQVDYGAWPLRQALHSSSKRFSLGLLMENGKETRKKQWDRAKASTLFLRVLKRNMCKRLPFQMYLLIGDIIFNDATWLTNTVSSLGLICSQGLCNDVWLNDGPHIRQWSHTVIRKLKPSHHLVTPKHPAFPTCVCCAGVSKPTLLPGV